MTKTISGVSAALAASITLISVAHATPVRAIAELDSITFYERTGGVGPNAYTFGVNGGELTTYLSDPLSLTNNDISGASTEYYDVYYSNADGVFDLDGEYLTISGVFMKDQEHDNAGGGLNLAEIALNFSNGVVEYGLFVASFVALGDNGFPSTVDNAIDGNLLTHTTMGNTIGQNERLRLTLGFLSSSGPEPMTETPIPGALPLFASALAAFGFTRRRGTTKKAR